MESDGDINYDTDLDDEQAAQIESQKPIKLSFDKKLAAHRSNRIGDTFGQNNIFLDAQSNLEGETNDVALVELPNRNQLTQVQVYEDCCRELDITGDWEIKAVLAGDTISLTDRSFSFNDFRAFATAVDENLESLTLHSVGLTSRSLEVLCLGLKKCTRLRLLDLSGNKIAKNSFNILVDTINALPSLLYLSLADCNIQDSYGVRIGDLCRPKNLLEINLSGNAIEESGCIFIGHALVDNTSLIYVNLSWNLIRGVASIAVLRGIEVNETITELDVSWSGLSYDGSVALRRILLVNKVLQRLNISNCNITWVSAKLISQGLQNNSTLISLNLAYNPITTHGVNYIIRALTGKTCAVSLLDISGITVFSSTVRQAEKIAQRREFVMKYDCEICEHDVLGQESVTKTDSMRKVIEHIDRRRWRTLEYFRVLDKKNKFELEKKTVTLDILKTGVPLGNDDIMNIHERLTRPNIQPLTYKSLHTVILQQRLRDRSLKSLQQKQTNDLRKRNVKILETVSHHFPDIQVQSPRERLQDAIEKLAKPRALSAHAKVSSVSQ